MANEPDLQGADTDNTAARQPDKQRSARQSSLFSPRPSLSRGFDAYAPPAGYTEGTEHHSGYTTPQPSRTNQAQPTVVTQPVRKKGWFSWLRRTPEVPPVPSQNQPFGPPQYPSQNQPFNQQPSQPQQAPWPANNGQPAQPWQQGDAGSGGYVPMPGMPDVPAEPFAPRPVDSIPLAPRLWEKQPYAAIAHTLALGGTLTTAWLLGILFAQILPGNFSRPPLQESLLRKSSRLTHQLWHLPQLWHSPTVETKITAVPIPTTGPVVEAVELSPVERQPLIDELNAVETEVLTLDRRLQTLEKRLGQPPYEGADINQRINTLRSTIDPPVRSQAEASYEPEPSNPNDKLLDVVQLKITLPSDALFSPGQSSLKDAPLLRQVLDQLVNYPNSTILIRSYSDNQAETVASRKYTLEQANAIANYLQKALPTTHRWVTLGGGQTQPLTENTNAAERQQNRRIEILVDTRS